MGVHHSLGAPVINSVASAIPARSAPILITFAETSSEQHSQRTGGGYRVRMTLASPRPVTSPNRAHINCTPTISGRNKSAVHSGLYPNEDPVTEYVAMPEGASSAAPVITPGPSPAKNLFT